MPGRERGRGECSSQKLGGAEKTTKFWKIDKIIVVTTQTYFVFGKLLVLMTGSIHWWSGSTIGCVSLGITKQTKAAIKCYAIINPVSVLILSYILEFVIIAWGVPQLEFLLLELQDFRKTQSLSIFFVKVSKVLK